MSIASNSGDGPDVEELHSAGLDKLYLKLPAALCDPRAHAGVDGPTKGLSTVPAGLSQDHALPKMAEDGRAAR